MLLRKERIAQVVKSYLRGAGLSQEKEAAVINAITMDAEVIIMEIVRRGVKKAVDK